MKNRGEIKIKSLGLPVVVIMMGLVCLMALSSCSRERRKILALAREYDSADSATWQERVDDIKKTIRMYEDELTKTVKASEYLGEYYKTLAVLYMDKQMYGEAARNLAEAIRYYPEKPVLFYLNAVCEARSAKAFTDPEERIAGLRRAEDLYKRALSLDRNHSDSLYGLSVLYVFELEEPWRAEPLLERLLGNEPSYIEAKFLLARVYVSGGNTEAAVELYDDIIAQTKVPGQKTMAEENKRMILEGAYGR